MRFVGLLAALLLPVSAAAMIYQSTTISGTTISGGLPGPNTSVSVAKPVGATNGEIIVLALAVNLNAPTITAPAGWTLLRQTTTNTGARYLTQAIYWKTYNSADPANYVFSWTGSKYATAIGHVFGGVNTASLNASAVTFQTGTVTTGGSDIASTPSVTITASDQFIMGYVTIGHEAGIPNTGGVGEQGDPGYIQPEINDGGTGSPTCAGEFSGQHMWGAYKHVRSTGSASITWAPPNWVGCHTPGLLAPYIGHAIVLTASAQGKAVVNYRLDEASWAAPPATPVIDSSANLFHGQALNAIAPSALIKRFGAASANMTANSGAMRRVTMPEPGPFSRLMTSEALTFAAWVYPTANPSPSNTPAPIITKGNSSTSMFYWMGLGLSYDGSVIRPVYTDNQLSIAPSVEYGNTNVPLNQWTHLAMVFQNGRYKLYKNGALVNIWNTFRTFNPQPFGSYSQLSMMPPNDLVPLEIGQTSWTMWDGWSTATSRFVGYMDNVCVYDTALTAGEVSTLAGDTTQSCPITNTTVTSTTLTTSFPTSPTNYVHGQPTGNYVARLANTTTAVSNVTFTVQLDATRISTTGISHSCAATGAGTSCGTGSLNAAARTITYTGVNLGVSGQIDVTVSGTVLANATASLATSAAVSNLPGSPTCSGCTTTANATTPMRLNNFLVTRTSGTPLSSCGGTATYSIFARDSSNVTITNFLGAVTLGSTIGGTSSGTFGGTGVVGNTLTFTGAMSGGAAVSLANPSNLVGAGVVSAALGTPTGSDNTQAWRMNGSTFTVVGTDTDPTLRDNPVAGRAHPLRVSITPGCGPAGNYTGNKTIKMKLTLQPGHPGAATLPTITAGGTSLAATTSYQTFSNVSFNSSGVATFSFSSLPDIGRYSLDVLDDTTLFDSANVAGSTGILTARPFALVFSNPVNSITSATNPGTTVPGGTAFAAAGHTFTSTVRALQWQAADDLNVDGVPDGGANLSDNGAVPSHNHSTQTTLSTTLVAPSGGALGTLGTTWTSVSPGVSTASMTYNEVGAITLRATSANYLGSSLSVYDLGAINVGRFYPARLDVSYNTPSFTIPSWGCGFSYVGQDLSFSTAPVLTITAKSLGGANTTTNYRGTWMKLTSGHFSGVGYLPAGFSGTPSINNLTDNNNGTVTVTFNAGSPKWGYGTVSVPFNAEVALKIDAINDGDAGVSSTPAARFGDTTAGNGIAFTQGKEMRYGRLVFTAPTYSQPVLTSTASVGVKSEFYNSSLAWATNTADSCTNVAAANVREVFSGNLSACETNVTSGITLAAGLGTLTFSAAGAGNDGQAALTMLLNGSSGSYCNAQGGAGNYVATSGMGRSYLQFGGADPTATLTFGSTSAARARILYRREVY